MVAAIFYNVYKLATDEHWTCLQSYTVYFTPVDPYTTDDSYKQWDKVVVPTSNVSGTIQLDKETYNILPHRQYKVRVTATNDLSEGPASETISFRTGSGGDTIYSFQKSFKITLIGKLS